MKKLLVTLLVAATSVNFVACGSSNKGNDDKTTTSSGNSDKKVTLKIQAEKEWVSYYEKVKDTIVEKYPNATIEILETGSFDHLDVLDKTDATNSDIADVFALPADRLYSLAKNQVLAAMPADEMAKEVGGFNDFENGLGGNFKIDGEYLAFPYNIETLIGYVNVENAKEANIDTSKEIEFTSLEYNQILTTVHDAWYGVAFTNSADFDLLSKDLKSDATKEWSELTEQQKKLFEGLYNYWKAHKENNTSLWDKEAAGGYIDEQFKTGENDAVKIDGPWATSSVSELVGSDDNLQIIPLSQITFNGQPLKHWKGGWGLGINARCEDNEEQMEIAEAFIKELINPENAKELFYATGKILENATIDNYQGIDKLQLKVIEATYDSYKVAENRPLFSEYGQVWDTWQNALLSWSAKKPANAEEAYKEVKASFDGMMANLNQ